MTARTSSGPRPRPAPRPARRLAAVISALLLTGGGASLADLAAAAPAYARWSQGPSPAGDFFPIAVWLQDPALGPRYREAGFNTLVGLWRGPTEAQLAAVREAGLRVICQQNEVGLRHREDRVIMGWMHEDEPDNAQAMGPGQGYGPPVDPGGVVGDYRKMQTADPTRPILLNLGQGVAWDAWHGRGVRKNHPEDYPRYIEGADIVSFDIYPVTHAHPDVAGRLDFVARGVQRLVEWSGGRKVVWNCIECTRIHHPTNRPTPAQVKAEVWMSLIHGSQGLIYFVHEWEPRFNAAALLGDPEMLAAVTALNRRIIELAPVLNAANQPFPSPRVTEGAGRVAVLSKHQGVSLWIFAVEMSGQRARVQLRPDPPRAESRVRVLDEDRYLPLREGGFEDWFEPWGVHLYEIAAP